MGSLQRGRSAGERVKRAGIDNKGWLADRRQQANALENNCRRRTEARVNRLLRQVANNAVVVAGLVLPSLARLAHLGNEEQQPEESREGGQRAYHFMKTH